MAASARSDDGPVSLAGGVSGALQHIREREDRRPDVLVILGSGLGGVAQAVEDARIFPTADLPGYPPSTVEGHRGQLVFGKLAGRMVLIVQGRVHLYEGHSAYDTAFPVRLGRALGAERLLVTNAAGGINPAFRPGTLMFITDQINLGFTGPLVGPHRGGPRFPDMSAPYDLEWLRQAEEVALRHRLATRRGVYLWSRGPSYETKAEIRFFRRIGADAVGMSTVPEVVQARQLGMRVLGISSITNPAAGLSSDPLSHAEVLAVGKQLEGDLKRLVRGIVAAL